MGKVTNSLPKSLFQRVLAIFETPLVYLFGRDIFISYARSDAANYAQQLAIDLRARVPKFSFFLDQWASQSGRTLPLSLRLALRWSQMLVFVGTERAIASEHVRHELETFFNRKGRFVPIDVEGVLTKAMTQDEFLAAICGPGAVLEKGDNVTNSTPSDGVVTRIVNAVNFTRQDRRLRRAVVGTTLGVIAVIATAYFVSQSIVVSARTRAQEADKQAAAAKEQQVKALIDVGEATFAAARANADQVIARLLTEEANQQARLAETKRIGAERLRDQARVEAARQSEIATTRQRANQSELTLRQSPTRLAQSVSLAVESMNRAHAIGIHSLEADRALRASLSLLPRTAGVRRTIEGRIVESAISPDGKHVAVLRGNSSSDLALEIQAADGRQVATFPYEESLIALSNDARRVSLSDGHMVRTSDISGSGKWEGEFTDTITNMALSPDGKYLLLAMRYADLERNENRGTAQENETFAEVWDVETGKRVTQLQIGFLILSSVAFSANGHFLAVAGSGEGAGGVRMGRALVWDLRARKQRGILTAEDFRVPDELLQDDAITAVAPSPDERYIVTASGELATVWKKSVRSGYREVSRMPIEDRIRGLAFNSDGSRVSLLSGRGCPTPSADCRGSNVLETWESSGYWEAATLPHRSAIRALSFQPDDESISSLTTYGKERLRAWSAKQRQEIKNAKRRVEHDEPDAEFFTSDLRYVATREENVWSIWDTLARKEVPVVLGVEFQWMGSAALSPDGSVFVLSGKKKGELQDSVSIYKRETSGYVWAQSFPLAAHVTSVAVSSDNRYLVASPYRKGMEIFELWSGRDVTPRRLRTLRDIASFEIAPDGAHLAVLVNEGNAQAISIWRFRTMREIATLRSGRKFSTYTFGSSTNYFVASMADHTIELLNIRTGQKRTLRANDTVKAAALSADGTLLAVADDTGLLTVFEVSTGDEIAHLQHQGAVSNIAFSNDKKYVATSTWARTDRARADEDHVLHVWLLRPRDLIAEACQRLTRFSDGRLPYCAVR